MAARFAHEPGTVVLLSGGDLDCARYHILGIHPWLTLSGRPGETTLVIDGATHVVPTDPLDGLTTVLNRCRLNVEKTAGPIAAGLFGYLAYDLKDGLEDLPRTTIDDLGLPHLYLVAPALIVVHDKTLGMTRVHAPLRQDQASGAARARIDDFLNGLTSPPRVPDGFSDSGLSLKSNFTRCRSCNRGSADQRLHCRRRRLPGEPVPAV